MKPVADLPPRLEPIRPALDELAAMLAEDVVREFRAERERRQQRKEPTRRVPLLRRIA